MRGGPNLAAGDKRATRLHFGKKKVGLCMPSWKLKRRERVGPQLGAGGSRHTANYTEKEGDL